MPGPAHGAGSLSAYAVILGAELNAELELQTRRDTTEDPEPSSAGVRPRRLSEGERAGARPRSTNAEPLESSRALDLL